MTIKRFSKTLTGNDNDKQIIEKMKELDVWQKMRQLSVVGGGDKVIVCDDYIFQWHSNAVNGGYTSFHSIDRIELLGILTQIKQKIGGTMSLEHVGTTH